MINEKVMNRILDGFEETIRKEGVKCMHVADEAEFLRSIHENGMAYDGFVIIKSSECSGIFYMDTGELLSADEINNVSTPFRKMKLDIPAKLPPLNIMSGTNGLKNNL